MFTGTLATTPAAIALGLLATLVEPTKPIFVNSFASAVAARHHYHRLQLNPLHHIQDHYPDFDLNRMN